MLLKRLAVGLVLLCSPVALAQGTAPSGPQDAANQIRLNRPASGADEPSGREEPPGLLLDISPDEALRLYRSTAFSSVELGPDEGSGPYLKVEFDESQSFIFLLNCRSGRCRSLMFTAFLASKRRAGLTFVNRYNLKTLHTKMAKNAAGETVLTMPAGLDKGVSPGHLRALAGFWIQVHRDALAWK